MAALVINNFMNKCIIYPGNDGRVLVIYPHTTELSIEEIAALDVPEGKPYKIVDISDIPEDRTFREAWEYIE